MSFTATHVAPEGGLRAWSSADGSQPPAATIDAGVPMQILEWSGAWAHVLCANAWSAWVDGRLLLPLVAAPPIIPPAATYTPPPAAAPPVAGYAPPSTAADPRLPTTPRPFPVSMKSLVGAALVLVSLVLPWARVGSFSVKPFDVPVGVLVNSASGFDLGVLVLVLAVGLCVPNPQLRAAAAVAVAVVAVVFVLRLQRLSLAGPGVLFAIAGAAAAFPLRLRQGMPGS